MQCLKGSTRSSFRCSEESYFENKNDPQRQSSRRRMANHGIDRVLLVSRIFDDSRRVGRGERASGEKFRNWTAQSLTYSLLSLLKTLDPTRHSSQVNAQRFHYSFRRVSGLAVFFSSRSLNDDHIRSNPSGGKIRARGSHCLTVTVSLASNVSDVCLYERFFGQNFHVLKRVHPCMAK